MMLLARRFLVLAVLMFWIGGFTFYAAVVVPMGQKVLGSHRRQGFVTQQVTNYLNLSCVVTLLPLGWDVLATSDKRWRFAARNGCIFAILATLVALWYEHGWLDGMLDAKYRTISDDWFYSAHRIYLWTSTVQWAFALAFIVLTLQAWRHADLAAGAKKCLAAGVPGVAQSPEHSSSETMQR